MSFCSKQKRNTDVVQNCFKLSGGTLSLQDLWISNGLVHPCGTFVLKVEQTSGSVRVFVNGNEVTVDSGGTSTPLLEGESFALTAGPLESIQVICVPVSPFITCILTFCLTLNYSCC